MTSRRSISSSASEYRKGLEAVKPKIDTHWEHGTPLTVKRRSSMSSLPAAVRKEMMDEQTVKPLEKLVVKDEGPSKDWRVCHVDFKRLFKLMEDYMAEKSTSDGNRKLVKNAVNDMHLSFLEIDKSLKFLTTTANKMLSIVEKQGDEEKKRKNSPK